MSKKSGVIILSATITATVFTAAATLFFHPGFGKNQYSAEVLEKAKSRQSLSVAQIPEPLETNLQVLSDEQKMAEKVAVLLAEDKAFLATVGDKSAEYVGEKISDLEEIYSGDMVARIDSASEKTLSEAKSYTDDVSSAVEFSVQTYADQAVATVDAKVQDNEALVKYLLSNEDFLDAIAKAIVKRTGKHLEIQEIIDAIIENEEVSSFVEEVVEAYHKDHPDVSTVRSYSTDAIPLPTFDVHSSEEYTEEQYIMERSAARNSEIDRMLEFLGY